MTLNKQVPLLVHLRYVRLISNGLLLLLLSVGLLFSGLAIAQEKPLLIDVRTTEEWNAGHAEGAILIPHDQIAQEIGQWAENKNQPIHLYCRTGRRAQIATQMLTRLGYHNVRNLGGLSDLQESGHPIITVTD